MVADEQSVRVRAELDGRGPAPGSVDLRLRLPSGKSQTVTDSPVANATRSQTGSMAIGSVCGRSAAVRVENWGGSRSQTTRSVRPVSRASRQFWSRS